MSVSLNNRLYWRYHSGIAWRHRMPLRLAERGCLEYDNEYTFDTAFLIALECLDVDHEARTLTITEKGKDGLAYLLQEGPDDE